MGNKYQEGYQSFFGRELGLNIMADPDQLEYVKAMIAPPEKTQVVFCNSKAGTGKTMLAVAAAYYMLEVKNSVNKIIYYRNTVGVREQGFLPGSADEKDAPYMEPFIRAITDIGLRLNNSQRLYGSLLSADKVECRSTTYDRGLDYSGNLVIIIDEAQNMNLTELRTLLTRAHDTVKVIVIGSSLQVDSGSKVEHYGPQRLIPFEVYESHLRNDPKVLFESFTLRKNYRGNLANSADEIDRTIKELHDLKNISTASSAIIPSGQVTIIDC